MLYEVITVRRGVTPEIHALSTLVMAITVTSVMVMQKFIGAEKTATLAV